MYTLQTEKQKQTWDELPLVHSFYFFFSNFFSGYSVFNKTDALKIGVCFGSEMRKGEVCGACRCFDGIEPEIW